MPGGSAEFEAMMDLPFHRRWEKVGLRPDLEELLNPPVLAGHDLPFSRVAASQRLMELDTGPRIEPTVTIEVEATVDPDRVKPKAKPKKKILRKFARGDFVNILMGVEDAPEVNPRGLPYDPVEGVWAGLRDYNGENGPGAELRRRQAARKARLEQERHIPEKAFSLSGAPPLSQSMTSEDRDRLIRQHTSIAGSAKLSQLDDWFSAERLAQREMAKTSRRPIMSPKTQKLLSAKSVPDLRKSLHRMGTTTRWTDKSSRATSATSQTVRQLIYSYDPAPDLASYTCGLTELDVSPSRRMVDHCLRSA